MKVTSADFIRSAFKPQDYPAQTFPEVAFAGKSNVGKSSLINLLLHRNNLARISSTPGRTQSINFFLINKKLCFVDLPGYGFAKVPLEIKRQWKPMVEAYLSGRQNLALLVVILDCRREPAVEDIDLIEWLRFHHIPLLVAVTKVDKISNNERTRQKALIRRTLSLEESEMVLLSAVSGEGKEELWKKIQAAVTKA